jgi:splicing factor 3A subunit 1
MVVTGIIRPPPEIRAVADRTALYVAKNGRAFEQRILNSAKGQTPKFAFLHANSPFHAYYEDRIQHYEANGGVEDEKKEEKKTEETKKEETPKPGELPKSSTLKASAIDPVAKALLTQRNKIIEIQTAQEEAAKKQDENDTVLPVHIPSPRVLSFVDIVPPASASIAQLEEIQLVAQLVALAPTHLQLLQHITHREWNNPAFGFCQPRHGHFAYFSALVDAYRIILSQWKNEQQQSNHFIQEMADNVPKCLEVASYRAEYERHKNQQSSESTETAAMIDWHDFVVVETIDFPVDEIVSMLPPPPPPPPVPSTLAATRIEDRMEQSDEDEEGEDEPIRVVPSYKPKVVAAGTGLMDTVIDPITGKKVNIKDLPEHMRIQLLDPKWAEERKKFQDKQKESNLVTGDVVASNLERFAQARGDRFGKKVSRIVHLFAFKKIIVLSIFTSFNRSRIC